MIHIERFEAKHYLEISMSEPHDEVMGRFITSAHLSLLENHHARTLRTEYGNAIACFGVYEQWSGNGNAWAILDKRYMKQHMTSVHKWALAYLRAVAIPRIEALVQTDFAEGHRWLKLLGFKLEAAEMKKYYPNGKSASLYARIT